MKLHVFNFSPDPDLGSEGNSSHLVLADPDLQPTNLIPSLPESELESNSSNPQSLDTTSELCNLPVREHNCSENVRSVVEVAIAVRASISAIDDRLLSEFLHHPQQAAIQELLELADELVAAETRDLVLAVVGELSRDRKLDLWRVLRVEERAAIVAVMAESVETLPEIGVGTRLRRNAQRIHGKEYPALANCEVVAVNGVDWVVRSACGSSFNVSTYSIESGLWEVEADVSSMLQSPRLSPSPLPLTSTTLSAGSPTPQLSTLNSQFSTLPSPLPSTGSIVSTLAGLVGVVKYVFQSVAKPFLVYHESIGRTICYRVEELIMDS
jgi:hypothetical protein